MKSSKRSLFIIALLLLAIGVASIGYGVARQDTASIIFGIIDLAMSASVGVTRGNTPSR